MKRQSSDPVNKETTFVLEDAIRRSWSAVIDRFGTIFMQMMPPVGMPDKESTGQCPVTLEELISAIKSEGITAAQIAPEAAGNSAPIAPDRDIPRALAGFAALRQALLEEISRTAGQTLNLEDSKRLNGALDKLAQQAIRNIATALQQKIAVDTQDQNKFLRLANHELRGKLNGTLLTIQVMQGTLAGDERVKDSLQDLERMRRAISEVFDKIDQLLRERENRLGSDFAAQRNFR